jgi:hypothetical protein
MKNPLAEGPYYYRDGTTWQQPMSAAVRRRAWHFEKREQETTISPSLFICLVQTQSWHRARRFRLLAMTHGAHI